MLPPCNRKGRDGNPSPKGARASALPDTKWAEALWCQRAALGGSATMRARTRVNAEQASKHLTREPTLS